MFTVATVTFSRFWAKKTPTAAAKESNVIVKNRSFLRLRNFPYKFLHVFQAATTSRTMAHSTECKETDGPAAREQNDRPVSLMWLVFANENHIDRNVFDELERAAIIRSFLIHLQLTRLANMSYDQSGNNAQSGYQWPLVANENEAQKWPFY